MSSCENKRYFLFDCNGFMYCVSKNDVLTINTDSIEKSDVVNFRYGTSTFSGTVLDFSSKEKNILAEIKRLKKSKKPKLEKSFHEDRPREAALKQKEKMARLHTSTTKASSSKGEKKSQRQLKVIKKEKKTVAEMATEQEIATVQEQREAIRDHDEHDDNSSTSNTSASSIAPVIPEDKSTTLADVASLAILSREVSDTSGPSNAVSADKMSSVIGTSDVSTPATNIIAGFPEASITKIIKTESPDASSPAMSTDDRRSGDYSTDDISRQETMPVENSPKLSKKSKKYKSKQHKRKSKKHRRRSSSSSSSSTSSSSSSSSDSSSESDSSSDSTSEESDESRRKRKKRKHSHKKKVHKRSSKKSKIAKRNMNVYEGTNYLYSATDPGVVKLNSSYEVYVVEEELNAALASSKSVTQFIRVMVEKIYTEDAILNATPQGFPARSKGKKRLKRDAVLPRLHPDGRLALIARAESLENERKTWRPRQGTTKLYAAFTGRCSEIRGGT